ncbi:MAG: hypothetical protein KC493_04110 [Bacteriovoracaceae bacterium]|nr:hypothetical protein [Bacteriovoracaceae bacterium]
MKRLFKNINKTSLVITLLVHFVAFYAHADSSVGIISKLSGNAFQTINGKTRTLKVGDEVSMLSEVLTSSGSQLTLTDYFDHQYHISGSSHIKMVSNGIELRRGYLWIQSYRKDNGKQFSVQTANAFTQFGYGEGIISFDPHSSKSQLLVMKGNFLFSNLMHKNMPLSVDDGHFSFLSNEVDNGAPRQSTPVGFASFKKVTTLFDGIKSMDKGDRGVKANLAATKSSQSKAKRTIASTKTLPIPGTVIYVKSKKSHTRRTPASASSNDKTSLLKFYYSKVGKAKGKNSLKKSGVPVKVWGSKSWKRTPASTPKKTSPKVKRQERPKYPEPPSKSVRKRRKPASISIKQVEIKEDDFEKGLSKQYKKQMRHSSEVNGLIRDLKSYDKDFKTAY